jgi:hypothetical protein
MLTLGTSEFVDFGVVRSNPAGSWGWMFKKRKVAPAGIERRTFLSLAHFATAAPKRVKKCTVLS